MKNESYVAPLDMLLLMLGAIGRLAVMLLTYQQVYVLHLAVEVNPISAFLDGGGNIINMILISAVLLSLYPIIALVDTKFKQITAFQYYIAFIALTFIIWIDAANDLYYYFFP